MAKDKQLETYTPEKIYIKGGDLHKILYERVIRMEQLSETLLQEIVKSLEAACSDEESVVEKTASLLVALEDGHNLSVQARMVKVCLERASEVVKEHRELNRFGKTLMQEAVYALSWEEAERFGL